MIIFYFSLFIGCCILLYFSGEWVVEGLMNVARYLKWREFVVAFLVMSFATSLPNLFVGVSSALKSIPQLSLGDVVGGNVINLTLAIALAIFFTKDYIPSDSKTVQTTSLFSIIAAVFPLLLIIDGQLSQGDGIVLILTFFVYIYWLFSKKHRFTRVYNSHEITSFKNFQVFLKSLIKILIGIAALLFASQGITESAMFFAQQFNLPLELIGILVVGLCTALPEIYFAIASAIKNESWMILGNLMGSVVVPSTLILGTVAIISPIKVENLSVFLVARFFLIISALFFFFFVRSDKKVSKKEGVFLLAIYILFIIAEIIVK